MKEKVIRTNGICSLQQVPGTREWLWGSDFTYGDLYEAEELFKMGHRVKQNRLILVHTLSGELVEPVQAREGQYFGTPCFLEGRIMMLYADFPGDRIYICGFDPEQKKTISIQELPLHKVADCYNLMLHGYPLMLTRQAENRFQVIWPEESDFPIDPRETFCVRNGNRLYFSKWFEDPDYREEVVVRELETGSILEQFPGSIYDVIGDEIWILR